MDPMKDPISLKSFTARLKDVSSQERLWLSTKTPGVDLAYEVHKPEGEIQDLLVFYHGGGAHGRAGYDRMAQALAAAGPIAVCLPDIRGHGSSGGARGHVCPPQLIWDDVDQLVATIRHTFPGARIHLGGHSSGAGMLLNHLTRRPPRELVESLIFLAPEFGWRAKLARRGANFETFARIRHWPFLLSACTGGVLGNGLPAVYFQLTEDAKEAGCLTTYSVGMSNAVTPNDPIGQLGRLVLPTHIAIADEDQLIDADLLKDFIVRHGKRNIDIVRLPKVDHLGVILDAIPFLCNALGYQPSKGKKNVESI